MVLDGPDSFHLRLDGVHHPDGVDIPDKRGLPINRGQDALERLIGGHLIGTFFSAEPEKRIGKKAVVPSDLKFNDVRILRIFHIHTSKNCIGAPSSERPVSSS